MKRLIIYLFIYFKVSKEFKQGVFKTRKLKI
jgi:hypothetical protein